MNAGFNFLALIQGGIGEDVWDKEKDIFAADFRDATNQACALAEELGGQVVSLEQNDRRPNEVCIAHRCSKHYAVPALNKNEHSGAECGACIGWQTCEPPKDGTEIIVVGRVIWQDEFSTTADPFTGTVQWTKPDGGVEGWHWRDGLSVARTLDDEVKIDWWIHLPKEDRTL